MKIMLPCAWLLAIAIATPALAGSPQPPDIEGTYRVRGECYGRTTEGKYVPCVAWNELTLKPSADAGRYAFALETNMFATTQGGCSLEGEMTLRRERNAWYLIAERDETNECPVRFKLERRAWAMELSRDNADSEACRRPCSSNASLSTDPFPLRSRKK